MRKIQNKKPLDYERASEREEDNIDRQGLDPAPAKVTRMVAKIERTRTRRGTKIIERKHDSKRDPE
jgi:hypothetical protein